MGPFHQGSSAGGPSVRSMSSKKRPREDERSGPRKCIIDTDPGIDDMFALFMALASPEDIQIVGITIVMGNHRDLAVLARNAASALHLCGCPDVPVVLGAERPLHGKFEGDSGVIIHGENGIGG